MRKHIFVRPVRPGDGKQFLKWSLDGELNEFDPDVAKYPTTRVLCAFDSEGPLVFMPLQAPLFMESLAVRPGAEPLDVAAALRELTHAAVLAAFNNGNGEIYFLGTNEMTSEFAKRQLFEELPYRVFRLKLKDLEVQKTEP